MKVTLEQLNRQQQFILKQAMHALDKAYDPKIKLIGSGGERESDEERHSTRSSIHYALGLLLRNQPGDLTRACDIIPTVLDLQLLQPEEIYYGTFLTSPQAIIPPSGNYPWKKYGPGITYFLNDTFEKFKTVWLQQQEYSEVSNEERQEIRRKLTKAFEQVIPPVWNSYDPNWREFIASTFAVMLELFENTLPDELIARIDIAMHAAVQASIDRKRSDAIPMNTNIELMHLFIVDYYAHRYKQQPWTDHVHLEIQAFLEDFRMYGTFAEFNSATYYGVDLTVLGLMHKFSKLPAMKAFAQEVEAQLWRSIAQYYNAQFENLAGPYSRAYEMDMKDHSSIGVLLYLALGEPYVHLAGVNCETSHDTINALIDVHIPEDVLPQFKAHTFNRYVVQYYKELCERHEPGNTRYLCKTTTWIEKNIMLGAISGSKNTSGQLHPVTIHWRSENGETYYMRLLRREPNGHWSNHYRGIIYDAEVHERTITVEVKLSADHDLELFFELSGQRLDQAQFDFGIWRLPGLNFRIDDGGLDSYTVISDNIIEQIYTYDYKKGPLTMRFVIDAQLTYD